jgi:hypothetical protein
MINALEIEMYPALLMQDVIDTGVRNFIPRYLAFSDDHSQVLVHLMRVQNEFMHGQELQVKPYWELVEGKEMNPQKIRF